MSSNIDDFGLSRAKAERVVREKLGWPITGGPRTLDWELYVLAVELQLQVLKQDSAKAGNSEEEEKTRKIQCLQ